MTLLIILVVLETFAAIRALEWALPRSDRAFFSIFVGDALIKLSGLAMATWWLWSRHLPYTRPLLALGFALLFSSLAQIPFFCRAH